MSYLKIECINVLLTQIEQNNNHIKILDLTGCKLYEHPEQWGKIFENFPNLEKLWLTSTFNVDAIINFSGVSEARTTYFRAFTKLSKKLKFLDLGSNALGYLDADILTVLFSSLPVSLEVLGLSSNTFFCFARDWNIKEVFSALPPGIKTLEFIGDNDLTFNDNYTWRNYNQIANLPSSITTLNLSKCKLHHFASTVIVKEFPETITMLDLSDDDELPHEKYDDYDSISFMLSRFPQTLILGESLALNNNFLYKFQKANVIIISYQLLYNYFFELLQLATKYNVPYDISKIIFDCFLKILGPKPGFQPRFFSAVPQVSEEHQVESWYERCHIF